MVVTSVAGYVPSHSPPPGRLQLVPLDVSEVMPAGLRVPGVTVTDVSGGLVLAEEGWLRSEPSRGGGPLAAPGLEESARAFTLTNVAWSARRLLDRVESELGLPLPPLRILVGRHETGLRRWGGGHYRLPASSYSELPEDSAVDPAGEVHLGSGRAYVAHDGARYLHVPGHNVAVVSHEVAHHVCRHVADFRLNRLRPPLDQTNRRTAIEEGTCDYLAAVMIGHPDIYGWHRSHVPTTDQRRRSLAAPWTMADFRGGQHADPHMDGSVWACALWAARTEAVRAGHRAESVDAMLLHGLDLLGRQADLDRSPETRRARKYYGTLLAGMLEAGPDPALAGLVERVMAARGIRAGWSNARAREVARRCA